MAAWTTTARGPSSTSSATELTEMSNGGDGGVLGINATVELSMGDGAWLQSPFEDVAVTLGFAGGVSRAANVTFQGNLGQRFPMGDFNFDGLITVEDWQLLLFWGESDLQGLTRAQAYRRGDLNGDNQNNIIDVGMFIDIYAAANGGALIPEPGAAGDADHGTAGRNRWLAHARSAADVPPRLPATGIPRP